MKHIQSCSTVTSFMVAFATLVTAITFPLSAFADTRSAGLAKVKILAMGGTIAGTAASSTETKDYKPGSLDIGSIISSVPGLEKIADISGEQVANIDSSHMTNDLLIKLANRINHLFSRGEADGIVITHGTDTLEETAYFLNLTVKSDRPVVLVGSMRPATAISADGPLNLYNAVILAAQKGSRGRGILVALNEKIYGARDVTKTNTTNVDTFQSPGFGCLGYVLDGRTNFYQATTKRHTRDSEFDLGGLKSFPRVDIIYGHVQGSRDLVDAAIQAGARGIVHAGAGNGSIFPAEKQALTDGIQKGVVTVRASRVGSGMVTRAADYDRRGFVASNTLNPQKARILLMLALTRTKDPKEIQRMFDEY